MALVDDLIATATTKLKNYFAIPGINGMRKAYLDLAALLPSGLTIAQWQAIDLKDFADIIEQHRAELRPWIMVYPAALGLLGPWAAVLNVWSRSTSTQTALSTDVDEALNSLFRGYVTLITT